MKITPITERLKIAIKNSGRSQRQIAGELGISPMTISNVLGGRNFFQFDLTVKLCELLDISMDWLVWGHEAHNDDTILGMLDDAQSAGRAKLEYYMKIIDQLEQTEKDDVYEFLIIEADKRIRTIIDRRAKTATVTEERG